MENQSKFIERISEEFICYKSVERTYSGISFDPEKCAKSLQREFAQSCNEFADKLEIVCTTDEQKDEAKTLFADYAEKRKAKFLAWAYSMSRCLSPMITGPANFPVRRNEKANATERKRLEEYLYYVDNAQKKIIKEIKNINKAETLGELTEANIKTIYEADGIRIINNYLAERMQIMTDSKPEAVQIDWLKKNGFKWSPSNKAWQRQNTANGKFAVKQYIHKFHNSESK